MSSASSLSITDYCHDVAERARTASWELASLSTEKKNGWLRASAQGIREGANELMRANAIDLAAAPTYQLSEAEIDRLRLTPSRIEGIAKGLEQVASLDDPIGEELERRQGSGGLDIRKVRVPLGVVFFIYESRPNVTADAAAICLKSGNAVILRGGKEAAHSSQAIVEILRSHAADSGVPLDAVQLIDTPEREVIDHLLRMPTHVNVVIPRGGTGLIRRVTEQATMPVLKHFDGNCHVYIDRNANLEMGASILENAKCQRMGVCNACESLLLHESIAEPFLKLALPRLAKYSIEIRGDEAVCRMVPGSKLADEEDWSSEYLGPILSVKIVPSIEEAIRHINRYGSHHTDAIVTENEAVAEQFLMQVDSAAVMVNASTRFNDGGEFGMGAEIGISTDKFHARGPCGLKELTIYKYLVRGQGHIRS